MNTNQNMEIKEGQETALVSAWTLCYLPICVRGTYEWIQSELDTPGSIHAQRSHTEFTLTDPCDRSPRPPQINGSRQGPTPPHTCIRMPSLRPPRARPEPSGANLKTHSDLASRTPTGPGASAGRRKMRMEEAGTQQLPTRQLPQNIRPTQLPGREWI